MSLRTQSAGATKTDERLAGCAAHTLLAPLAHKTNTRALPHRRPHLLSCSKAIAEKHREEGRRKLLAEEKAALPKKKKGGEESSETFFDRCAAMDRRLQEARVTAIEAHEKASRPKPTKHKWAEVQGSFLKRWTEFNAKSAKNLEELDLKTRPTFRLPGQEPKVWADVADSFFESQQKALDKIKEREEAAEAAEKKGLEKIKVEGIKVKCVLLVCRRPRARPPPTARLYDASPHTLTRALCPHSFPSPPPPLPQALQLQQAAPRL
jgi:hypothetical protein